MAEEPQQEPRLEGEDKGWLDGEERFWTRQGRRPWVARAIFWFVAGAALTAALNQLGCSGFLPT
jgi:hypothetical protein